MVDRRITGQPILDVSLDHDGIYCDRQLSKQVANTCSTCMSAHVRTLCSYIHKLIMHMMCIYIYMCTSICAQVHMYVLYTCVKSKC